MEIKPATKELAERIEKLLHGSIDMHVHHGPDGNRPRRLDAIEVAVKAQEYGMKAIVLKQLGYPSTPLAIIAQKSAPNVSVFGGVCLELEGVGGLNALAVETSAKLGAKVIWMPIASAVNSRRVLERLMGYDFLKGEGISLLGPEGQLVPQVTDILEIIRDYNMVLATGHISPREIFALVEEAHRVGVSRIVATHVLARMEYEECLSIEEQQQLAEKGVFMEHCYSQMMPVISGKGAKLDPGEVAEAIKRVGAEHCIMCSDFGHGFLPPAPEGIRMFIAVMLRFGLSEREIGFMVQTNPSRLLGLT